MSMKVKDLKPNANATLRVRVCAPVGQSRKVQTKKGYQVSVCTFMVGDETGAVEYSAFGKDVMTMSKNVGKVIDIKDAWVKEWEESSIKEHQQVVDLLAKGDIKGAAQYIHDVHWSFIIQEKYILQYYFPQG